jgi:hypothetical protein
MGKTAMSKLSDASLLDKEADKLRKRDPESAAALGDMAHKKRSAAIKQMRRRPKRTHARANIRLTL